MDNALPLISADETEALEKIQVLFSNGATEHEEEARSVETTPPPGPSGKVWTSEGEKAAPLWFYRRRRAPLAAHMRGLPVALVRLKGIWSPWQGFLFPRGPSTRRWVYAPAKGIG
ncbi:hypothetical protein B296_00048897 [Ensete ventricosum]|uniref:Uncharacterized protein n=1 Tax=Ensete ventricosum TaxID=4639 RepID=A0A426YSV5_ENSVE|nr:hypothetical protein B296_00048897 [Ensete ventricosum]